MGILQDLLKDIPVPKMAKVKVKFDNTKIDDLEPALLAKLQQEHITIKSQTWNGNCRCSWKPGP